MSDDMEIQKIILRLTRRYNAPGHELVNDDGPAAVAIIEALQAEVERLKGEAEELRKATIRVMASLAGAISLLERGGKAAKKAAPSDNMFAQMLDDYSRALDAVRDLLNALEAKP